jgi:hypothetical protein
VVLHTVSIDRGFTHLSWYHPLIVVSPTYRGITHLSCYRPPIVVSPTYRGITHLSWYHPPIVVSPTCRGITHLSWYRPPVVVSPTYRVIAHLSWYHPHIVLLPTYRVIAHRLYGGKYVGNTSMDRQDSGESHYWLKEKHTNWFLTNVKHKKWYNNVGKPVVLTLNYFVVLHTGFRGITHKSSWYYTQAFVVLHTILRGITHTNYILLFIFNSLQLKNEP